MDKAFEYEGHQVEIRTSKRGKYWDWSFVIDATTHHKNNDSFARSEEQAISEATDVAKRRIQNGQL